MHDQFSGIGAKPRISNLEHRIENSPFSRNVSEKNRSFKVRTHVEEGPGIICATVERSERLQTEQNKVSPTKMICQMLQQHSGSEEKMDVFSGNPIDYKYFQTTFREVVEKTINSPVGRVTRLIKLTDDKAKDMKKHYIYLLPESGYQTAMVLLKLRYGNPHSLLAFYRKEIK